MTFPKAENLPKIKLMWLLCKNIRLFRSSLFAQCSTFSPQWCSPTNRDWKSAYRAPPKAAGLCTCHGWLLCPKAGFKPPADTPSWILYFFLLSVFSSCTQQFVLMQWTIYKMFSCMYSWFCFGSWLQILLSLKNAGLTYTGFQIVSFGKYMKINFFLIKIVASKIHQPLW